MFWKKKFKITVVPKKLKTLQEVANDGKVGDVYYFRIEKGLKNEDELVLYAKTPIGYNTSKYKLPLSPTFITLISTKCKGNRKFWEEEIVRSLNNHWRKYE